jgi:hypothetical protein
MSWGAVSDDRSAGAARLGLALEAKKESFISEATAMSLLFVDVGAPRASARGRLALCVEGAIERALDGRGAPGPSVRRSDDLHALLSDQIARARAAGATGLSIWFGPLESITAGGLFDGDDSAVLRFWVRAASEHPVQIAFDVENRGLGVFLEPVTLESILADAARAARNAEPSVSSLPVLSPPDPGAFGAEDEADSAAADDEPSPLQATSSSRGDADPEEDEDRPAFDDRAIAAEECAGLEAGEVAADERHADRDTAARPPEHAALDSDPPRSGPTAPEGSAAAERLAAPESETLLAESARALAQDLSDDEGSGWLRDALMELSTPPPRAVVREVAEDREPARADEGDTMPPPPGSRSLGLRFAEDDAAPKPFEVDAETRRKLEGFARELESANGPKPLAVVERLFASAYVPLRAALDRGADLPRLRETADAWADSFGKSYVDAFDALRVRNKRPTMVVDVPDITLRIARLHGARSTQLLLVDAMRFDLGEMVHERLRALVGQRAACADRMLVWSALPTRTAAQVELIGRGPSGLREFTGEVNEDLVVARGRKASMIRRLKAGNREVLKLDIVEARLAEPGGALPERAPDMADEVAQRIAAHFEDLQPRTLVMVFGDHGYKLEPHDGTVTARQGGASPDEVLVPAFAWLVGAVH